MSIVKEKTICIMQPYFMPWAGYFERIMASEVFVLLDHVQFEKGGYTNRVKIMTETGEKWITIPTNNRLGMNIVDVAPYDANEAAHRFASAYKGINHGRIERFLYGCIYQSMVNAGSFCNISSLDFFVMSLIMRAININPPEIKKSSEMALRGIKSGLILEICKKEKATKYLSGQMGKNYLDFDSFEDEGIEIEIFEHKTNGNLSIVDSIMRHGCNKTRANLGVQEL